MSEESKTLSKEYEKSENDLKALQSVGQVNNFLHVFLNFSSFNNQNDIPSKIVGEVLKQLTEDKCKFFLNDRSIFKS